MAVTTRTSRKKKTETELQNGEVLNVEGVSAAEINDKSNDTVVILSNFPRNIRYQWQDDNGNWRDLVLNGNAVHLRGKESGVLPVGGYGVTTGVPKKAWDWIVSHRPKDPLIVNGLVFASTAKNARAEAKERKELRNGFEPVDPNRGQSRKYNG